MKNATLSLSIALLLASCNEEKAPLASLQYQISSNQYAIVVIQEEGMTDADAKQSALQSAAQLTHDKNFRYFTVESEEKVTASLSRNPNMPAPRNMYYDMIQSHDFSKDQLTQEGEGLTPLYPAYRIVFKCYTEKPPSNAVDACTLIDCSS